MRSNEILRSLMIALFSELEEKPVLKLQFRRMIHSKSFVITVVATLVLLTGAAAMVMAQNFGKPVNSLLPAWQYYNTKTLCSDAVSMYVILLMPLSCSLLHSASYFDDLNDQTADVLFTRGGKAHYWGAGLFLSFMTPFILALVSLLACQGLLHLAFPADSLILAHFYPTYYAEEALSQDFGLWRELALSKPSLYFALYALFPALYAGLLSVAAYGLGMLLHKRTLVVFLPGLVLLAVNFLMGVLNLHVWGYFRSLLPGYPAWKPVHMAVNYLSVLIVDVVLLVMGIRKNRDILPGGQGGAS